MSEPDARHGRYTRHMHRASFLLRQILVLNEVVEYQMRRRMQLNETDFNAMQHLLKHRSMAPGDLAQALHLTSAATTSVVDRLVAAGHVSRTPHPSDRRRWIIEPTEEAAVQAMSTLMPMLAEADAVVVGLEPPEQQGVVRYLEGVVAAMQKQIKEMDAEFAAGAAPEGKDGKP